MGRAGYNASVVSSCQSFFWVGFAMASLLLLPRLDNMTRKNPIFVLVALGLVAAAVSCLNVPVWLYTIALFLTGFTFPAATILAAVCVMENVPESSRSTTMAGLNIGYSSILIVMAGLV